MQGQDALATERAGDSSAGGHGQPYACRGLVVVGGRVGAGGMVTEGRRSPSGAGGLWRGGCRVVTGEIWVTGWWPADVAIRPTAAHSFA